MLSFRRAEVVDATELTELVRAAYRGERSRGGWTTEADLLDDQRIDVAGVVAKITEPDGVVLVGSDEAGIVSCCELVRRADGVAYFGMFAIWPERQAAGLGRGVLAEAEAFARREWDTTTMEMTVIAQRAELIAWYERRGYVRSEQTRPFPYEAMIGGPALRDDLYFAVLTKDLQR